MKFSADQFILFVFSLVLLVVSLIMLASVLDGDTRAAHLSAA